MTSHPKIGVALSWPGELLNRGATGYSDTVTGIFSV